MDRDYIDSSLHLQGHFVVTKVSSTKQLKPFKYRTLCEANGLAPCNGVDYCIFSNSLQSGLSGLVERLINVPCKDDRGNVIIDSLTGLPQLKTPPKPKPGIWKQHAYFKSLVVQHIGPHRSWTEEEFIETRRNNRLRKRYTKALEDYTRRGLLLSDSNPQALVKAEKMKRKSFMTPRIIQYCNPVYNLLLGKYISSAEKKIYAAIDLVWDPSGRLKTIMKNYNAEEVATLIVYAWEEVENRQKNVALINQGDDNVAIMRIEYSSIDPLTGVKTLKTKTCAMVVDAERFDQHVHYKTLLYEHSLYMAIYEAAPAIEVAELALLLARQREYQIKSWFKCELTWDTYRVDVPSIKGRRRSGDMNTSVGNNFIATALLHGFFQGYEPMTVESVREKLAAYCLDRGFSIKFEGYAEVIEEIEFCQTHPVNTGHKRIDTRFHEGRVVDRWIMVRNLDSLCKDSHFICEEQNVEERMSQIGIAGSMMYADIPIHGAFYKKLRNGKPVRPYSWQETAWTGQGLAWQSGLGMNDVNVINEATDEVTDVCRVSYTRAFGVTPTEQTNAELDISRCEQTDDPNEVCGWLATWYKSTDNRTRTRADLQSDIYASWGKAIPCSA